MRKKINMCVYICILYTVIGHRVRIAKPVYRQDLLHSMYVPFRTDILQNVPLDIWHIIRLAIALTIFVGLFDNKALFAT